MWNWGYDAVQPQPVEYLPREICVSAWFTDTASHETNSLPEVCIDFVVSWTGAPQPSPHPPLGSAAGAAAALPAPRPSLGGGEIVSYFQPDHSAAHAICGEKRCRLNVHVVFKVTTGAAPTDGMLGGAAFSFDGGAYVAGGSTFYEQHIDSVGGQLFSAMQADFDRQLPLSAAAALPKKACFKVWVENAVTSQRAPLNTSALDDPTAPLPPGWVDGGCLAICRSLHAFHTPYCPGGR